MAVALIAQSAVGAEVWPADTPSRATTTINPSFRIRFTPFGFEIMYQEVRFRKGILQPTREAEVEPLNGQTVNPPFVRLVGEISHYTQTPGR